MRPVNIKYKKMFKPKVNKNIFGFKNNGLSHGVYGIKVINSGRVGSKELESVRRLVNKRLKKKGAVFLKIFPDKFTTSKPLEVRMGKGKGSLDQWVCLVNKGEVILEIVVFDFIKDFNIKVLEESCRRLSLNTKIVRYLE